MQLFIELLILYSLHFYMFVKVLVKVKIFQKDSRDEEFDLQGLTEEIGYYSPWSKAECEDVGGVLDSD